MACEQELAAWIYAEGELGRLEGGLSLANVRVMERLSEQTTAQQNYADAVTVRDSYQADVDAASMVRDQARQAYETCVGNQSVSIQMVKLKKKKPKKKRKK